MGEEVVGGIELNLVADLDFDLVDSDGGDWIFWCRCASGLARGG